MTIKTEKEIRDEIAKIVNDYSHVIDSYPATVEINAPKALMQLQAKTELDTLYWSLGEKRPRFKFDDTTKMDY